MQDVIARGAPQELPRALRFGGEGALEEREREPAHFEVGFAEQAIADEQERGRSIVAGRCLEPANDGRDERPADTVRGAKTRGDDMLAIQVFRVGELRQTALEGTEVQGCVSCTL